MLGTNLSAFRRGTGALAVAAVLIFLGLVAPTAADAGPLLAAPATVYNSTPDCPVSATTLVCGWNVPADAANLFTAGDYGQCPYWAAEKYPELVLDEILSDPLGQNWNGGTWLEHAVEEGLGISSTPASGDLAVFQATAGNPAGHVAYVEAIDGDAIIVSQMDGDSAAPFPALQGSTEYISAANLAYYRQSYGLEFISTGDPSSTPISYVEAPVPAATTTTTSTSAAAAAAAQKAAAAKRAAAKRAAAKRVATQRAAARRRAAAAKRRAQARARQDEARNAKARAARPGN